MTALDLADYIEQHHAAFNAPAAAMLRKQDAAIKTLREALQFLLVTAHVSADEQAKAALAATEQI